MDTPGSFTFNTNSMAPSGYDQGVANIHLKPKFLDENWFDETRTIIFKIISTGCSVIDPGIAKVHLKSKFLDENWLNIPGSLYFFWVCKTYMDIKKSSQSQKI